MCPSSQWKGWIPSFPTVYDMLLLRYYIIDLQESPKINFLSMNHLSHDLNKLLVSIGPMVEALAWLKLNINERPWRSMM